MQKYHKLEIIDKSITYGFDPFKKYENGMMSIYIVSIHPLSQNLIILKVNKKPNLS